MKALFAHLKLLWIAYPLAKARVLEHHATERVGEVKHLIAYRQIIDDLTKLKGIADADIEGAILQILIGIAYLFNKPKPTLKTP